MTEIRSYNADIFRFVLFILKSNLSHISPDRTHEIWENVTPYKK